MAAAVELEHLGVLEDLGEPAQVELEYFGQPPEYFGEPPEYFGEPPEEAIFCLLCRGTIALPDVGCFPN